MGKTQSYVKGGGSHAHVPVPLNSKVQLYRSSKKIVSGQLSSNNDAANKKFDIRNSKRIEWDIYPISQQGYDSVKYEIKKLPTRNKIDMSII